MQMVRISAGGQETEYVGKMKNANSQHEMNELVMRRSSSSGEGDVCGLGTRQN